MVMSLRTKLRCYEKAGFFSRMRLLFPATVYLFLSLVPALALDWYRWRGPDLNGISKESGWLTQWPASGPKQLWKASVDTGFSSMSVGDGRVYTMGNQDGKETVWCLNAATGAEIWRHTYDCPVDPNLYEGGPNATPTIDGQRVYTLSRKGDLFCFDAAAGKILWEKNIQTELDAKIPGWGFSGSPLVEGDLLVVNAGTHGAAFDKISGKGIWSTGKEKAGFATPVPFDLGGRRSVAIFAAKALVALDVKTGKELWRFPWKTSYDINVADPIISGDQFFISSGYGTGAGLIKLSGGKPTAVWQNKNMRNHFNGSVLLGGNIYGFDESVLKCLDWQSGAVKWSEKSLGKGSLMAADGKLIVLGEKGMLVVADASPAGFKPNSRAQVLGGKCWTTPVLSNGKIYCRNAKGDLICLDVGGK
jgi:outer membrane protein assembly factor BamB